MKYLLYPVCWLFAIIICVIIGTYSSIFVASPILKYTKVTQKSVLKEDN